MSKASVGFRKFGTDSFQVSNHRLIVRSTACCARCTAELAPTNVENSDSQKPSLKSKVKSPKWRVSVTNSSVGGSSTFTGGG